MKIKSLFLFIIQVHNTTRTSQVRLGMIRHSPTWSVAYTQELEVAANSAEKCPIRVRI